MDHCFGAVWVSSNQWELWVPHGLYYYRIVHQIVVFPLVKFLSVQEVGVKL